MARRPFDPATQGWKKTEYREGDVQDAQERARRGEGRRRGRAPGVRDPRCERRHARAQRRRLPQRVRGAVEGAAPSASVYASSVAAYGFHDDNPDWLTEDIEPRGHAGALLLGRRRPRSRACSARCCCAAREDDRVRLPALHRRRPEGPDADRGDPLRPARRDAMPGRRCARCSSSMPVLKPVIPDPGTPLPARARGRRRLGLRRRRPGQGRARPLQPRRQRHAHVSDLADALGWYSIPIPDLAVDATAEVVARLPLPAGDAHGSTACASRC